MSHLPTGTPSLAGMQRLLRTCRQGTLAEVLAHVSTPTATLFCSHFGAAPAASLNKTERTLCSGPWRAAHRRNRTRETSEEPEHCCSCGRKKRPGLKGPPASLHKFASQTELVLPLKCTARSKLSYSGSLAGLTLPQAFQEIGSWPPPLEFSPLSPRLPELWI